SFVRDQVDKIATSALLGPVQQQLLFLLAGLPSRSCGGELLAVVELILAGISEHGEWSFERRRRARSQERGEVSHRRAAQKRDEIAPLHLPGASRAFDRKDSTSLLSTRLLRCGISSQPISQMGH